MRAWIFAYLGAVVVFLAIDIVWITQVALPLFQTHVPQYIAPEPKLVAAGLFYLAYCVGVVFFCVAPAFAASSAGSAIFRGALFGLFCYGTYDVTNYATLKDWPLILPVVDTAWGTVLTAVTAFAGYLAGRGAYKDESEFIVS